MLKTPKTPKKIPKGIPNKFKRKKKDLHGDPFSKLLQGIAIAMILYSLFGMANDAVNTVKPIVKDLQTLSKQEL
jgi:hypothetical protein